MLSKKEAKKISQWTGDINGLMKYGKKLTNLTDSEIKQILTARKREDLISNAIPNNCVAEFFPVKDKILCIIWIQIKGWYGADKSYVKFTPDTDEQKKLFLNIANKHAIKETLKEEYFDY